MREFLFEGAIEPVGISPHGLEADQQTSNQEPG